MNENQLLFTPKGGGHLAIEQADRHTEAADGIHARRHEETTICGCRVSRALLDDGSAYHTLITDKLWLCGKAHRRRHTTALEAILLGYMERVGFCRHGGRVLFCGTGNEKITADALGPMVCDRLRAVGADPVYRAAGMTEVYVIKPGVPAQSGMATGEHIRVMAQHLGVDLILVADAMAAQTVKRLATVVQVTDGGITAGSGTGEHTDEISRRTMPCPVISLGVPTVIRSSVSGEREGTEGAGDFLVSHSEIDLITECYAQLIADAVNGLFTPHLDED